MKSKDLVRFVIALTPLIFTSQSFAECKGSTNLPPEQIQIAFEPNVAAVSASDAKRLEEWVAAIKLQFPIHDFVTVVGSASQAEISPKALATARAVAVVKSSLDDGLVDAPVQIKTQIYPSINPADVSTESREVAVQLTPGCLVHCCAAN